MFESARRVDEIDVAQVSAGIGLGEICGGCASSDERALSPGGSCTQLDRIGFEKPRSKEASMDAGPALTRASLTTWPERGRSKQARKGRGGVGRSGAGDGRHTEGCGERQRDELHRIAVDTRTGRAQGHFDRKFAGIGPADGVATDNELEGRSPGHPDERPRSQNARDACVDPYRYVMTSTKQERRSGAPP